MARFENGDPHFRYHEDGFRIRDVAANRVVSVPLLNCYFAAAFVWDGRVYVVAGDYEDRPIWTIRRTILLSSDDLITWTKPRVILETTGEEHFFNYGICRAKDRFVLLYETNDARWPMFTMRFAESDDLLTWRKLPEQYIYGTDKYTGGPALYYDAAEGWFYLLYTNAAEGKPGFYDDRVARSRDLMTWQDARADRPMVEPNPSRFVNAARWPGVTEKSASDLEMCEFNGQTHIYWIHGDQQGATCGWNAVVDQPMFAVLRRFFEE